jgi:hypothetical protein
MHLLAAENRLRRVCLKWSRARNLLGPLPLPCPIILCSAASAQKHTQPTNKHTILLRCQMWGGWSPREIRLALKPYTAPAGSLFFVAKSFPLKRPSLPSFPHPLFISFLLFFIYLLRRSGVLPFLQPRACWWNRSFSEFLTRGLWIGE